MDTLKPLPADSHRLIRTVTGKDIYIAGPMTGVAEFNAPLFDEMEHILIEHGAHRISNPARFDVEDGHDWTGCTGTEAELEAVGFSRHEAMRRNIRALLSSQTVVFLPGWRRSKGACLEWEVARSIGLDLFEVVWSAEPGRAPLHETFAKFGDVLAQALHPAGTDQVSLVELYQPAWSPEVAPVDPASLKTQQHWLYWVRCTPAHSGVHLTVMEAKPGQGLAQILFTRVPMSGVLDGIMRSDPEVGWPEDNWPDDPAGTISVRWGRDKFIGPPVIRCRDDIRCSVEIRTPRSAFIKSSHPITFEVRQ